MDVSLSLLFEDIADSETDAGPDHKIHADDAIAGDDAESCSCEASYTPAGFGDHQVLDHCDEQDSGASINGSDGDDIDHYEPINKDVALECSSREEGGEETNMGEINKDDPSKTKEINKDEMEDRLFWETCMAVGYP